MSLSGAARNLVKLSGERKTARPKTALCVTLTAFLGLPVIARVVSANTQLPESPRAMIEFQGDPEQEAQDRAQQKRDAEQAARDREQEKRDREQERRDREQEKKDREQERLEHLQELYDDGREDLDDDNYSEAASKFSELAALNGPQTDAALYWKAYAENRQGKREAALAATAELKRRFPQSRWKKDAEALEI